MEENKNNEWEKLKQYLLAVHAEYEDRNGLDYCKNCGVDFKELVEKVENLLENQKKTIRDTVATNLDKHCIYEVSVESLMTDNLSLTQEE